MKTRAEIIRTLYVDILFQVQHGEEFDKFYHARRQPWKTTPTPVSPPAFRMIQNQSYYQIRHRLFPLEILIKTTMSEVFGEGQHEHTV